MTIQPLEFSGRSVSEKLKTLREKLTQEKAYGIVITALDEVRTLKNSFLEYLVGDIVADSWIAPLFEIRLRGSVISEEVT